MDAALISGKSQVKFGSMKSFGQNLRPVQVLLVLRIGASRLCQNARPAACQPLHRTGDKPKTYILLRCVLKGDAGLVSRRKQRRQATPHAVSRLPALLLTAGSYFRRRAGAEPCCPTLDCIRGSRISACQDAYEHWLLDCAIEAPQAYIAIVYVLRESLCTFDCQPPPQEVAANGLYMELSWCRSLSVGNHVVHMPVNLGSHRDVCVCVCLNWLSPLVCTRCRFRPCFVHCFLRISAMADMQL